MSLTFSYFSSHNFERKRRKCSFVLVPLGGKEKFKKHGEWKLSVFSNFLYFFIFWHRIPFIQFFLFHGSVKLARFAVFLPFQNSKFFLHQNQSKASNYTTRQTILYRIRINVSQMVFRTWIDNRSVCSPSVLTHSFSISMKKSYEWEKGTYKITSVTKRTKGQKNDHEEDRC